MNIKEKALLLLVSVEDDIGIALKETAVGLFDDGNNLELLDSPDLKPFLLAAVLPGRFRLRGLKAQVFVEFGPD